MSTPNLSAFARIIRLSRYGETTPERARRPLWARGGGQLPTPKVFQADRLGALWELRVGSWELSWVRLPADR
jgi:hypothetical protein